jgi:3-hydroxyisobutyrate dehydrogenase-like beta-hydroxyacid dehydrogenase
VLSHHLPKKAFKGDFEPGFMVDLMYKDLGLALDLSSELNVPVQFGSASRQVYELARAAGKGRQDFSSILELLEERVGVKTRIE